MPGAENKPKNQFTYPGFNIGGPLLIPGTNFNKNRDRVFFFTGYEFYRQKLDTGTLQSWVPTAGDARRGTSATPSSITRLGNGYVNTIPDESRERPRSGQSDQPGRTAAHRSLPAAQRRPVA